MSIDRLILPFIEEEIVSSDSEHISEVFDDENHRHTEIYVGHEACVQHGDEHEIDRQPGLDLVPL